MAENYDHEVVEYTREVIRDIRKQLRDGAKGQGVTLTLTLTQDECVKLLACIKTPADPNHRPPKKEKIDPASIHLFYSKLVGRMPRPRTRAETARAVAETAKHFGCSKWTVNEVLRERSQLKK